MHSSVHHQFSNDQQGKRYEIADVNFRIEQEGNGRTAANHPSFESREHQEWQPRE